MKEKSFSVGNKQYLVTDPTAMQIIESRIAYNKAFRQSLDSGAYLRKSFDKVLEEQGLWSEEKTKKMSSLQFLLAKLERKINSKIKLTEARKVAIDLDKARNDLRDLVYERTALDDRTAEGQAEQTRIEYLCSVCLLDYDTRKRMFEDQISMVTSGEDFVSQALDILATMIYEVDPDFDAKLPENKFFSRFGRPKEEPTEEMSNFLKEISDIKTVADGDASTIEYEDDTEQLVEV